jgi:histidine triad (HIT) family protein
MNSFTHEPKGYVCPFCEFIAGKETDYNQKADIVYRNEFTTAFIAPKWWTNNQGHVLVVPNKHFENIYSIPDEQIAEVYKTVKKIAVAIRSTYNCDGTSTRQHNEPHGNQDVWHFHVHVYPRYENDKLYHNHDQQAFVNAKTRLPYAEKLRHYFATHKD